MTVVRDIMNKDVYQLRPDTTLREAIDFLYAHDCGGAPVVTDDGRLCGMMSELALLDILFEVSCRELLVSDFMTTSVHVIEPNDSLEHAAHMFELYGIRRLPVVDEERLVGIVTRRDLIQSVLKSNEPLENPLARILPGIAELQV